jgi:hypothetical protein
VIDAGEWAREHNSGETLQQRKLEVGPGDERRIADLMVKWGLSMQAVGWPPPCFLAPPPRTLALKPLAAFPPKPMPHTAGPGGVRERDRDQQGQQSPC